MDENILDVNFAKSEIDSLKISIIQDNQTLQLHANNKYQMVENEYIDIFMSMCINIYSNDLQSKLILRNLVINNQRIPLYNGYSNGYQVEVETSNISMWLTDTGEQVLPTTLQSNIQDKDNFWYPWGIIIVTLSGILIIVCISVITIICVRRRAKTIGQAVTNIKTGSSEKHSTYNSRNGLLNRSSGSASSSIFSGTSGLLSGERISSENLATPVTQTTADTNHSLVLASDEYSSSIKRYLNEFNDDTLNSSFDRDDLNLKNTFLSSDFHEFKQLLNWTPSFEVFKHVFDDLSDLSADHFCDRTEQTIDNNELTLNPINLSMTNEYMVYDKSNSQVTNQNFIEYQIFV